MDSGSQINLIDVGVLPLVRHIVVPSKVARFSGVQGHVSPIHKWVQFQICLANSAVTTVTAAVVDNCPCSIIFGQPFLIANGVQLDSENAILSTKQGPIKLLQCQQPPTLSSNTTVHQVDGTDEIVQLNLSNSVLTDKQKERLRQFLRTYQSLWRGETPGRVQHVEHRIRLRTDYPIRDRPRFHTPEQNIEINRQLEIMLKDGIIQPSKSEHSSEIVIAKKVDADGNFTGWRFCIDFRDINRETVKDAYPLPRISDLLHAVKKSKYFVKIDLRWGYWNIPLEKHSIKYTAFRCLKGLYEFLVMPFGLTNAPATFQRLMDFLFGDLRYDGVLAYLDDILLHGETFDEVLGKLKVVLDRIQAEGLKINLKKTDFFPNTLKYLGHIITQGTL